MKCYVELYVMYNQSILFTQVSNVAVYLFLWIVCTIKSNRINKNLALLMQFQQKVVYTIERDRINKILLLTKSFVLR